MQEAWILTLGFVAGVVFTLFIVTEKRMKAALEALGWRVWK